jgi:hypothetical protein
MPEHYAAATGAVFYATLNDPLIDVKCGSHTNV